MTYSDFLSAVIDTGIEAAKADYANDPAKRDGAIAGFSECRGKEPGELRTLLTNARNDAQKLFMGDNDAAYWTATCRAAEIEWVCNCISALLMGRGETYVIVPPTARAVMHVARILGPALPQ